MQTLPQFLSKTGVPIMSTAEYWRKFTFVMLMTNKNIQIDELLTKEEALTETEQLHMKIAKATFLTLIGDRTVAAMKNQNPKDDVLDQELKWIKAKWEEIWSATTNQNHLLIRLLKAKREETETIFDYWNKLTRLSTECKLDTKTPAEIISALIVAKFTVSVNDEEMVKTVWEKSLKYKELSKHMAKLHQTNQIMHQVTSETITIKQEPIGRVRDRERTREDRYQQKQKATCIRCGESW